MNDKIQAWVETGQLVDRKLDQNLAIVQTIPGLLTYRDELKTELPLMLDLDQQMNKPLLAETFDKIIKKNDLRDFLVITAKKAMAAGHILKKSKLEKGAKVTKSEFNSCGNAYLISRARNIFDVLQEYAADLVAFDVTQADREKLAQLLQDFSQAALDPKYSRAARRETNLKLQQTFRRFKETMKSIDMVVDSAEATHPDFFRAYGEVRKVSGIRSSNINLSGKILESDTRKPVNNVKVTLTPEDPEMKHVELMVTNRAGFRIKNLDSGFYNLRAYKPGYKEFTQRLTIISNEKKVIELCLERD